MSNKILILEPSKAIRAMILEKLKKSEVEVVFESSFLKFFLSILTAKPDILFINADFNNPQGFEFVRFLRSMEKTRRLPLGLYTTGEQPFEDYLRKNSGADLFIDFDQVDFAQTVEALFKLKEDGATKVPLQNDFEKSAISQRLLEMTANQVEIEKTAATFLDIITEFCEVPIAAVLLKESDGIYLYYVKAENISEKTKKQFLKVCATDFENFRPDLNVSAINNCEIKTSRELDKYNTKEVPLSSYQLVPIVGSDGTVIGSVNTVREGNFSVRQLDLLNFCTRKSNTIIENAIEVKRNILYQQNIRKAFSRFVPDQIIDQLVNTSAQQEEASVGEKRNVAILFSDIRSFTSISEVNKPEVIVAFLNRYFTTMVNIIKKHGGTIDKFIGDAIMALFGAPVSYEDNTRRAVAAACEMREALPSVPLGDLILPPGLKFNIGIGINYAAVTVGSIGSEDKTDYTVIGDGVNLASRLEGLTKVYGSMVLVSDSVKKDIKQDNDFVFRYLDDVKVKGKAKGVPIYSVDRSLDEFSPLYRDSYAKGLDLYKQGIFPLAREYFEKARTECPEDKSVNLMLERCDDLIANPPEKWDGAFEFHTK